MQLLKLLLQNSPIRANPVDPSNSGSPINPLMWTKDTLYLLPGSADDKIQLTHDIVRRGRKKGSNGDQKPGFRDEIVSTLLGKGGNGSVYNILGTLAFSDNGLSFRDRARVIKFIVKHFKIMAHDHLNVLGEYQGALLVDDFKAKPPVLFDNDYNYDLLVMQKIPGMNLAQTLHYEFDNKIKRNVEFKLRRCLAIFKAIKFQVTDLQLIHADIKPENIMMDGDKARIIDFSSAISIFSPKSKKISFGTPAFMAPEVFNACDPEEIKNMFNGNVPRQCVRGRETSAKIDVFSIGLTALIVFGLYRKKQTEAEYMLDAEEMKIDTLRMAALSPREEQAIIKAINQMLKSNPEERSSIDDVIEDFQDILDRRLGKTPFSEATVDGHLDRALDMLKNNIVHDGLAEEIKVKFVTFFKNIEAARTRHFCYNLRENEKQNIIASIVKVYQTFHGDKTCVDYYRLHERYGTNVTTSLQDTTTYRKILGMALYVLCLGLISSAIALILQSNEVNETAQPLSYNLLILIGASVSFLGSSMSCAIGSRNLFFSITRKIELPEPSIAPRIEVIERNENSLGEDQLLTAQSPGL